ncbi:SMI1/KNR4 family protein [Bacteroides uniformis]|uniref:SMI1/KNR4 family protein n=1 Tax=Bacteroides uniformis TaxID=820 RepID=UPI001A9E2366|nr:SMI1/KNR4 family protein [Bacteroides uniformis]UVR48235.1 SMI1/KNR4 family protein [Bacteroides fragilis]
MLKYSIPIRKIGESDWINKLTTFLKEFDIDVKPLKDKHLLILTEQRLHWSMPNDMKEYYLNFGGVCSDDFLFNLKSLQELCLLSDDDWAYVTENLNSQTLSNFIVYSESPSSDPLCIQKQSGEIFLFSHDPLYYAKVYNSFSDYLISEIILLQEQLGDLEFENTEEKKKFMSQLLKGDDIDIDFRNLKLE